MGIFDFILGKKKEESKSPETVIEDVEFNKLGEWIEKQEREYNFRNDEINSKIVGWKNEFLPKIRTKFERAKKTDLQKYKAEDRIKAIVNENFRLYLEHVGQFIEKLERLEVKEGENGLNYLAGLLNELEKTSFISYQKATILVGDEIGDLRESLKLFGKKISEVFKLYESEFVRRENIKKIRGLIKEHEKSSKLISDINNEMKKMEENCEHLMHQESNILQTHSDFLASADYRAIRAKEEEKQKMKEQWEKEIALFRQDLSLKFLQRRFHSSEKHRELLKSYESDIREAIEKDSEGAIIHLAKESLFGDYPSSLNSINHERLTDLKERRNEILAPVEKDERISAYESSLRRMRDEIDSTKKQIVRVEEKMQRCLAKQEEHRNDIIRLAKEVGLNLI